MAGVAGRSLDDETPLDGPQIDVPVRLGWLMRMARLGAGGTPAVGLGGLAERLGTNTTRLHRAETGQLRSGMLLNGYETALGLPPESLRAPVDVLCRGFAYAPPDREPGPVVASVPALSALTERVGRPGAAGADWLAWARALAQPSAIGLPEELGLAQDPAADQRAGPLRRRRLPRALPGPGAAAGQCVRPPGPHRRAGPRRRTRTSRSSTTP